MPKFKYNPGDYVGPNKILMLERTYRDKNKHWHGLFKCSFCNTEFEACLPRITSGEKKSCGCLNYEDLTGKVFGFLVALKPINKKSINRLKIWECKCLKCGRTVEKTSQSLKKASNKIDCGYHLKNDLTGKKFGKLTVLKPTDKKDKSSRNIIWACKCDCGNNDIIYVPSTKLTTYHTQSCGCLKSIGENKIESILKENNIKFKKQKTFNDCRNSKTSYLLYFDFYLPDYNCCIEYDGIQHFKINSHGWNNEEYFKKAKYRDNIKNEYCKNNNIKLIRIPYYDLNILNYTYLYEKILAFR